MVKLDESHVFFVANGHEVTVLNRLLVNGFNRDDFLPMVSDTGMNSVHGFNRQKYDTSFIAADCD